MRAFFEKIPYTKILSVLLVITLIVVGAFTVIPPKKADAGIASSCFATFFSTASRSAATSAAGAVSVPVQDIAVKTDTTVNASQSQSSFIKDCVEHGVALAIAKALLYAMTQQIVAWINGGFNGSPAFVSNPQQFFLNAGDSIAGQFILGSDLAFLCSPFQLQIRLALALNYNYNTQFAQRSQCTLTGVVHNVNNFFSNFNDGGWAGWISMTLNHQNNPYGSYLMAAGEMDARINGLKGLELAKLNWGNGFLSWEQCQDGAVNYGGNYIGGTGSSNGSTAGATSGGSSGASGGGALAGANAGASSGQGHGDCQIKTPGTVIAGTLQNQLNIPADQLGVAGDLDQIANALGDRLISSVIQSGLSSLSGTRSGSGITSQGIIDQLARQSQQQARDASTTLQSNLNQVDQSINNTIPNSPTQPEQNIALNAIATQSSVQSGNGPENLTDGNIRSGEPSNPGVFEGSLTRIEPNPWMQVDLGTSTNLDHIVVYQRTNPGSVSHSYPILHFRVQVLDANHGIVWQSDPQTQDFSGPIQVQVPANTNGEFVKLQAEGTGRLEITEIQVYKNNPPVITLKGSPTMFVQVNTQFTDPGYTASDEKDGDITSRVTVSGSVNTSVPGAYTRTYSVTDSGGAQTQVTRTVTVQ